MHSLHNITDVITHSVAETEAFAETFAKRLKKHDIIAFIGGLGAGKTAFTRGLARGLGYSGTVSSPTFTAVNEYLPEYVGLSGNLDSSAGMKFSGKTGRPGNLEFSEEMELLGNHCLSEESELFENSDLSEEMKLSDNSELPKILSQTHFSPNVGGIPLYHFDMYRITSEADLESIGFFDYDDGICAIEWFENIADFGVVPTFIIEIETIDENSRKIVVKSCKNDNTGD
jgi:tRNA A37 threonylcarbamoyladenosine biosynthesis protein TsaE